MYVHMSFLPVQLKSESIPSNIVTVPCNIVTVPCNTPNQQQADDVQKKISLLNNTQAVMKELFPRYPDYSTPNSSDVGARGKGGKGGGCGGSPEGQVSTSGLIVVAALVSKTPNQGGEYNAYAVRTLIVVMKYVYYLHTVFASLRAQPPNLASQPSLHQVPVWSRMLRSCRGIFACRLHCSLCKYTQT